MLVPHLSNNDDRQRQVIRTQTGSPVRTRRGFSLIELLIVIAILTIVAAFVLPAVQGPMQRSRLRSAAVDVQKAWGTARTLAIREGMAMEFRCELNGRRWTIERTGRTIEVTSDAGAGETLSGLRADTESSDGSEFAEESHQDNRLVREGWLPEGTTFDDLSYLTVVAASPTAADYEGDVQEAPLAGTERRWSEPLRFQPEGRSQDARLRVRGADRFVVDVNIRGLTSAVSFTAPFRHGPTQHDLGRRP